VSHKYFQNEKAQIGIPFFWVPKHEHFYMLQAQCNVINKNHCSVKVMREEQQKHLADCRVDSQLTAFIHCSLVCPRENNNN